MKNESGEVFFIKTKNRKPFERGDIFLYSSVLILIIILLCVFVIFPKQEDSAGFKVYKGESLVLTYTYEKELTISPTWQNKVTYNQNDCTITIFLDGGEFNRLIINESNNSVKMIESTCSESKDCVHSPAISYSGIIYCAPHDLKVLPLNKTTNAPPSVG